MVNNNLIKYTGIVNEVKGYILIDSGATNNFILINIDCLNIKNFKTKPLKFKLSDGKICYSNGKYELFSTY